MTADLNRLFYGDNLDVLRDRIASESVDLIYLDPPFNSNRSYNVLFKTSAGEDSQAQIEAFDDTWRWSQQTEALYREMVMDGGAPQKAADAIEAMRKLLGTNDVLAYLVMMTARLVELHRVLKPTGSLYLHCDPTASHYLKVVLDAIFGPTNFRNEVIWKRTTSHSSAKKYAPVHDVLLHYGASPKVTWNEPRTDYDEAYLDKYYKYDDGDGRLYWRNSLTAAGTRKGSSGQAWRGIDVAATGQHWKFTVENLEDLDAKGQIYWPPGGGFPQIKRYRDELKGLAVGDIWTDIDRINQVAAERLGYPTQKPLALLERIIAASSNEGDVVLDPFCGCGTTIDAAEQLRRRWIGIDVTYIAIDLIQKRLRHTYGAEIENSYVVHGIPTDLTGAQALFHANPFDFERWAVGQVNGQPNVKQVGDKGIDGRIRFPATADGIGTVLVSVKGGKTVTPTMIRDLVGTVEQQKAEMGLLITMSVPTKGVREVADQSGEYIHPLTFTKYPKVQVISVPELFAGKRPNLPSAINPYKQAKPRGGEQLSLM